MTNLQMRTVTYPGLLIFLLSALSPVIALAQKSGRSEPDKFKSVNFTVTPEKTPVYSLPVSSIIVHDVRPDTTIIGQLIVPPSAAKFITLRNGSATIRQYYSSLLEKGAGTGPLHCFIKRLQLTDNLPLDWKEVKSLGEKPYRQQKSGCFLTAEFYLEDNSGYIPLYRFDTLVSGIHPLQLKGDEYLKDAITFSLRKAGTTNWENVRGKSRLSIQQIDSFNAARFLIPALTQAPVKGVYLSFDDFKNNRPKDIAFEIEKEKTQDVLYAIKDGGKEEMPGVWGYSDGRNRYIQSSGFFFKLNRRGNGYMLYGLKYYKEKTLEVPVVTPYPGGAGGVIAGMATYRHLGALKELFQLDPETGDIF